MTTSPGPWRLNADTDPERGSAGAVVAYDGRSVALVYTTGPGKGLNNGRLLAAAPALLAALKALLDDAAGYARTHDTGPAATKRSRARWDMARATIEMAEGRTTGEPTVEEA